MPFSGGWTLNRRSTGDPLRRGFQIAQSSDFFRRKTVASNMSQEFSGTSSASSTIVKSICAKDLIELIERLSPIKMNSVPFFPRIKSVPIIYADDSHGSDRIADFSSA